MPGTILHVMGHGYEDVKWISVLQFICIKTKVSFIIQILNKKLYKCRAVPRFLQPPQILMS